MDGERVSETLNIHFAGIMRACQLGADKAKQTGNLIVALAGNILQLQLPPGPDFRNSIIPDWTTEIDMHDLERIRTPAGPAHLIGRWRMRQEEVTGTDLAAQPFAIQLPLFDYRGTRRYPDQQRLGDGGHKQTGFLRSMR